MGRALFRSKLSGVKWVTKWVSNWPGKMLVVNRKATEVQCSVHPATSYSSMARMQRSIADARSGACTTNLASMGS